MSGEPRPPLAPQAVLPPEPEVGRPRGPSLVWIVPLVVALVGGWLIYRTVSEKGPVITISFRTAEGIEAGKTRIRYKNIEVGRVESVSFSKDFSRVLIRAQMAREATPLLRRDTRFWVVRPRLTLRGVSGLATVVSGAYIELEPGPGAAWSRFTGLEAPPVVRAEEAGRQITLAADRLGSLDTGSPVYYRGILAGEVLGYELASDRKSVLIYAFIKAPFDRLVRANTRFWNVSGVDVSVGAEGLAVRAESVRSVLFGGIAFETPESVEPASADLEDVVFTLYENRKSIEERSFTQRLRFVLFFDGSVRGLSVGAPVEFKGIKVGQVVDVRLEFDRRDTTFRIPVLIEIEPQRVIARGAGPGGSPYELLSTLVKRGLRARLQTGSLLTGQLFVELDMRPDTEIRLAGAGGPYPELPTIPASLEEITSSVKHFLAKINTVDIEQIGRELLGTLQGANRLVNSEELRAALADLDASMRAFRAILTKVDRRVEPLADNVSAAATAGREALERVGRTLELLDAALASDSPLQRSVIGMADEIGAAARSLRRSDSPLQDTYLRLGEELIETARSIRAFVDLLERNPDAVLFGKPVSGAQ